MSSTCSAVSALTRAIEDNRLAHALLLYGENLDELEKTCFHFAGILLKDKAEGNPDCFMLRPTNKMRQISADNTRELIRKIQQSPSRGDRKVAIICEADRMHRSAANAFLKTLEEPPLNTTIFMLSAKPYALLDTIRSRCLNFRIPCKTQMLGNPEWRQWLGDYGAWIEMATRASRETVAPLMMSVFQLVTRFESISKMLTKEFWKVTKASLPEYLGEEESIAQESGTQKEVRMRLFKEIEITTRDIALERGLNCYALPHIIKDLERLYGLMEVNLNENTALEAFLLGSLRTWRQPGLA